MLEDREGEFSREIMMATLRKGFESEAFKKLLSKDGGHKHAFLAAGRKQGPGRTGNGRTADRWNMRARGNGIDRANCGEPYRDRISDGKRHGGGGGTNDAVPERG